MSTQAEHPALQLLLERARTGQRDDGARIALAIEGGGLAVSMATGMAHALERRGLTRWVDAVYGTSAGALIAAYAATRRLDDAAAILPATCNREFVDYRRVVRGSPVVSLDYVIGLVRERPPVADGEDPADLRVLVTGVHDGRLRTLHEFRDLDETLTAVRASMAIPFFAGAAVDYRGELVSDGGLIESIPVATPLAEGATHVIVLRSRDADYRKGARAGWYGLIEDRVINRLPGTIPDLIRARPARYDAEADALAEAGKGEGALAGRVVQLAPQPGTPLVRRLEADRQKVVAAMRDGARVVDAALSAAG